MARACIIKKSSNWMFSSPHSSWPLEDVGLCGKCAIHSFQCEMSSFPTNVANKIQLAVSFFCRWQQWYIIIGYITSQLCLSVCVWPAHPFSFLVYMRIQSFKKSRTDTSLGYEKNGKKTTNKNTGNPSSSIFCSRFVHNVTIITPPPSLDTCQYCVFITSHECYV